MTLKTMIDRGGSSGDGSSRPSKECKLCKANGSQNFKSHEISECWLLNNQDRSNITKATVRAHVLFSTNEQTVAVIEYDEDKEDYDDNEDKETKDWQLKVSLLSFQWQIKVRPFTLYSTRVKYESRNAQKGALPKVKIGDSSNSKAWDPYIIFSFVPSKNEVEVQKLLDKKRKNVIRVNLQNIYMVNNDDNSNNLEDNEDEDNSTASDQTIETKTEENSFNQ